MCPEEVATSILAEGTEDITVDGDYVPDVDDDEEYEDDDDEEYEDDDDDDDDEDITEEE